MRSTIGIRMEAPATLIHEITRDVSRWAEQLPHYRSVHVLARRADRVVATMQAVRQLGPVAIPVAWRAVCWPDSTDRAHLRLEFRHIRGITRGMTVTWHITPIGDGTSSDVRIVHEWQRGLPILGPELVPRVIDRWFVRPVASRTLATFRVHAEAAARGGATL